MLFLLSLVIYEFYDGDMICLWHHPADASRDANTAFVEFWTCTNNSTGRDSKIEGTTFSAGRDESERKFTLMCHRPLSNQRLGGQSLQGKRREGN